MKWFCYIAILCSCGLIAQATPDLRYRSLDSLYPKAIEFWRADSDSVQDYSEEILKWARLSGKREDLLKAYHIKGLITQGAEAQLYVDSLLNTADIVDSDTFRAVGYFLKARNYYTSMDYKESLDYFLKTRELLETTVDSTRLKYLVKDNIGVIRLLIGDNEKAIELFTELLDYYAGRKGWNSYLMTQFSLAVAYHQDQQFEKSQEVALEGLQLAKERESDEYYYLLSVFGANLFSKGRYGEAIDSLEVANRYFIQSNDWSNQSIAHYFLGQSHVRLGNQKMALQNFRKVDSMFRVDLKNVYPLTRPAWEVLIDDAKARNDREQELYYITSLLKVDSVTSSNYKYANRNLTIKYDMQELVRERDKIVQFYQDKNLYYVVTFMTIFMLAGLFFLRYRRSAGLKMRTYRKTIQSYEQNTHQKKTRRKAKPNLSKETLNDISDGLAALERANFFLDASAKLPLIARKLGTNPKYLSMYVNHYEGKSFSNYLNDLRVDHLIERLRSEEGFRKRYTLDAIAKESGFTSNEHLSRAFKKRTSLKPSDYLNLLDEERGRNS